MGGVGLGQAVPKLSRRPLDRREAGNEDKAGCLVGAAGTVSGSSCGRSAHLPIVAGSFPRRDRPWRDLR